MKINNNFLTNNLIKKTYGQTQPLGSASFKNNMANASGVQNRTDKIEISKPLEAPIPFDLSSLRASLVKEISSETSESKVADIKDKVDNDAYPINPEELATYILK